MVVDGLDDRVSRLQPGRQYAGRGRSRQRQIPRRRHRLEQERQHRVRREQPGLPPRARRAEMASRKWAATVDAYKAGNEVNPRGTPAVADIDGDGTIEIIAPKQGRRRHRLSRRRLASSGSSDTSFQPGSVTIAIADMDNDGKSPRSSRAVSSSTERPASSHLRTTYTVAKDQYLWGRERLHVRPRQHHRRYRRDRRLARPDGRAPGIAPSRRADSWSGTSPRRSPTVIPRLPISTRTARPSSSSSRRAISASRTRSRAPSSTRFALPGTGRGAPPTISDFDNDGALEIASANGTQVQRLQVQRHDTEALRP